MENLKAKKQETWLYRFGLAILVFGLLSSAAWAQRSSPANPKWPHINLSTWYKVDPGFFQRPAGLQWGDMAGITLDRQGQIWLFTRAEKPVQVYDAQGRFVRAWGEGLIQSAHFIRIDPSGLVWLADNGNHVVMQFTPEGKLLRTLGTPGEPGEDATHLNRPTWRSHLLAMCSSPMATAMPASLISTEGGSLSKHGAKWGLAPASSASPTAS